MTEQEAERLVERYVQQAVERAFLRRHYEIRRERDAAIQRAEAAERERDALGSELKSALSELRQLRNANRERNEFRYLVADAVRLTGSLQDVADDDPCLMWLKRANAALDGSGEQREEH